MLDQIANQQKKAEESEYNATNYTVISDYKVGKFLGTGAYASVKQLTHKATGLLLAVKIYEKYTLMNATRKKSVVREIFAL